MQPSLSHIEQLLLYLVIGRLFRELKTLRGKSSVFLTVRHICLPRQNSNPECGVRTFQGGFWFAAFTRMRQRNTRLAAARYGLGCRLFFASSMLRWRIHEGCSRSVDRYHLLPSDVQLPIGAMHARGAVTKTRRCGQSSGE